MVELQLKTGIKTKYIRKYHIHYMSLLIDSYVANDIYNELIGRYNCNPWDIKPNSHISFVLLKWCMVNSISLDSVLYALQDIGMKELSKKVLDIYIKHM